MHDPSAETFAALAAADVTYRQVGATRDGPLPAGYGHVLRDVVVGRGRPAFERAAEGLFRWQMHREAGLEPVSDAASAVPGAVVILRAGLGPLRLTVPCRVVYIEQGDARRGFAYGTLPGHPEQGEEAFLVVLEQTGEVHVRIRAFSRSASPLARAGGPVTRLVQAYVTNRYISALRHLAHSSREP
jgi:uncharacterized protein (UPF0548 family)